MMNDFWLRLQIAQIIGSGPWLMVAFVAGIVCMGRLSTRPREAWLVICALAVSLFADFGVPTLINLLVQMVPGISASSKISAQLFYSLPIYIFHAAAWGLMLYAAFGEGSGPRSKYLIEPDRESA